jgi:hypothetical protein
VPRIEDYCTEHLLAHGLRNGLEPTFSGDVLHDLEQAGFPRHLAELVVRWICVGLGVVTEQVAVERDPEVVGGDVRARERQAVSQRRQPPPGHLIRPHSSWNAPCTPTTFAISAPVECASRASRHGRKCRLTASRADILSTLAGVAQWQSPSLPSW